MLHNKNQKLLALLLIAVSVLSETALPAYALEADSMSFVGIRKSRTAKILDDFKGKQQELLFENTPFMLGEESGLFDAESKVKSLEQVMKRLENSRAQYQKRKLSITEEKITLRNTLKRIDDSVEKTLEKIRDAEIEIVKGNRKIAEFESKIAETKAKIEENRKTILEYLSYVYTRGDLVYSDVQEVDIVKSIILNDGNFSDILNDIHYKSLLESAGQNFVEIRRNLLKQYYLDTESLKAEKIGNLRLKNALRDRRKDLEAQRAYKEQLLRVTQGQEALFNRFIMQKAARENDIAKRIEEIENGADGMFANFASRYGCVPTSATSASGSATASSGSTSDSSGATDAAAKSAPSETPAPAAAPDSKKCREVRKFFESEKALRDSPFLDDSGVSNVFLWPVEPRYVSAYYKDQSYYASVGSEHEAIDIPAEQGSDVIAPADGYVYFVNPPVEGGYGYVALKHTNGYLTIYGHVSEVMAERFQFVRAGEVFAKSGGAPGTPGAGVMTSGAHLHFEVHRNRSSLDPLRFLDLTRLRYETLDAKYAYKYVEDLKARYGRRANISTYDTFRIVGDDEVARQKFLLEKYAVGDFRNWDVWTEEGSEGKIDPSFLMCVGLAETGLGKNLKTAYNVGNVGNTDSGGTYDFPSAREGIYWMVKTLNNRYLGQHENVSDLSRWGNKDGAIYASSSKHWHTNVIRCLSALKGRFIEDDYKFRLSPEEAEEASVETVSVEKESLIN